MVLCVFGKILGIPLQCMYMTVLFFPGIYICFTIILQFAWHNTSLNGEMKFYSSAKPERF